MIRPLRVGDRSVPRRGTLKIPKPRNAVKVGEIEARTLEVMVRSRSRLQISGLFVVMLIATLLVTPVAAGRPSQGQWWRTVPEVEVPSPYYDSILYSEIAPTLREIEMKSNRVRVEVIGQSAGGRNLFLVTVSAPEAFGRLGRYQALRQLMVRDPAKAQEMIEQFEDFKVPFYIHASIHGTEYPGVDAAIELIRTLAFDDTEEVREILDNVILLVDVVANPDGRVLGTYENSLGFNLNRDFITQSQPETRAAVSVITKWNPMVCLDLHGFMEEGPMLIEPCTPPHNPNYEYDLYVKWALAEAEAMETELLEQTGNSAVIPFRDWSEGWDDWPPIFTPMYAMYHGAYGHTLETIHLDYRGVQEHYWAVWGALRFVAEHRREMVRDQIEIFRRGFLNLPPQPIPAEILSQTPFEQYNYLIDYPAAYVIPTKEPLQQNPYEATKLVNFLLYNDVRVEQASEAFRLDDVLYPKGTYIVWLDQPKRGLANTILWNGWDISYDPGLLMYDISGWSHPLLWGVTRGIMMDKMNVKTCVINKANMPKGSVEAGTARAYAYLPTCNEAIEATNALLARGVTLYRAKEGFVDAGRSFGVGTFIVPANQANAKSVANELASKYGLRVFALRAMPSDVSLMRKLHIAVLADEGVRFFLKEYGFDFDDFTVDDLNGERSLAGYDVFLHAGPVWWNLWDDLNSDGRAKLLAFFAAGGDYVGIGGSGADLNEEVGLLSVEYDTGSWADNGIIRVTYDADDSVAAQYPVDGYAFVYGPVWFTSIGGDVYVSATIQSEDFFVSGFWSGWMESGVGGMPVVVHGAYGDCVSTLIGFDPTFRAHPEHTFRILANAIYQTLG